MVTKITRSHLKASLLTTSLSLAIILSTGCSNSGQFPISSTSAGGSNSGQSVDSGTSTGGSSSSGSSSGGSSSSGSSSSGSSSGANAYQMTSLAWESSSYPQRTQWSAYLQEIISTTWSALLPGADDMDTFCPKYSTLSNDQRANVWAQLFVGVAKYESAWSPTSRYLESTMGTDPITGKSVYSEGLLQLSYQDIQVYPFCQFDWNTDRNLSSTDPNKTILDPYKNLYCGVGIMVKQIARSGLITVSSNAYWSTLRKGGSYQQISGIAAIVKKLPFCN